MQWYSIVILYYYCSIIIKYAIRNPDHELLIYVQKSSKLSYIYYIILYEIIYVYYYYVK